MTALKGSDVDAVVSGRNAKHPVVLVFGPDSGLVTERVQEIISRSVENPQDPFSLARLDGDALAETPSRLVEEAHTVPLFGGRRAVWVKAGNRSIVDAVDTLLAAPPASCCRIVIEAGDLKRNAPLRTLCEKSKDVAAIACYTDGDRDLTRVIDDEMKRAGLTITPDARSMLVSLIGGDRLASRSEINKLALYAHGKTQVDDDDVYAVVADASALANDGVIDAAFAGKPQDVETEFSRARGAGTRADVIAGAALRQAMQLHKAKLAMEGGASADEALSGIYPSVNFRRKAAVETALRAWSSARLEQLMEAFSGLVLDARRDADLAEAIVRRALLATAEAGRRK